MTKEPLRTEGKRKIEMTTAEWIGRLLLPVDTFPSKLKEGCGEILKLRQEKEIASAVEWLEERQVEEWIRYENGEISLNSLKYNLRTHQLKAFEDVKE